MLWLWHRPAATAPIRPLAWKPPCAAGAAQEIAQKRKQERHEFLQMAPMTCQFHLPRVYPKLRGPIGAIAAGLYQSHTNAGSEPHLQPTPQLTAMLDPYPTERGQRLNPHQIGRASCRERENRPSEQKIWLAKLSTYELIIWWCRHLLNLRLSSNSIK